MHMKSLEMKAPLTAHHCNFEAVKRMVESCNVQGTARFDGLKWTWYVDSGCQHWTTMLSPSLLCCGLCIFWTAPLLCRLFSSCLPGRWHQAAFARTRRHLQGWHLPSDTEKMHCNSGWSFQGTASEPCSHCFGLPFRTFLLLSRYWACHWHHHDDFLRLHHGPWLQTFARLHQQRIWSFW